MISPNPTLHSSGADKRHSFWRIFSMFLGVVIGSITFFGGISFIIGALRQPDEKNSASQVSIMPAVGALSSIVIKPGAANPMSYDVTAFTVKSGQPVKVTFFNDSVVPMPHNLCICKPGSKDTMLAEAMKIMADPNGLAKGFIPDTPLILWHTRLLNPKESQTLEFTPSSPGDYPYMCTFPGHSTIMNGVMKVE